jgi:type III restriction enzyme
VGGAASPKVLVTLNTKERQAASCSASELRRGSKSVFYAPGCEDMLEDEQKEFFREVEDPDGDFASARIFVGNSNDFKAPVKLAIADGTPERKFLRELTKRENASKLDAWLKNTPLSFYSLEYAWKKGNKPKRGEFSPDFFIKQGKWIFVTEIKGDDEIADPSPENVKKYEYATEHFKRLNEWLKNERIPARYQFNMVTPKDFGKYFTKLRGVELEGFRSELDVKIAQAGRAE